MAWLKGLLCYNKIIKMMFMKGFHMYHYTLAFLIRKDQVLLLNRNKSPWMGAWNGVGGKIHDAETPLSCIVREIEEETGITFKSEEVFEKGTVTWDKFNAKGSGLYLFVAYLPDDFVLKTPLVVDEGILDWKTIDWASDLENQGIARNIPYFLKTILHDENNYNFACTFHGDFLAKVEREDL